MSRRVPSDHRTSRWAWREAGPVETPVDGRPESIVLLHGLGGSRISWEPQLAGLSNRYRVIAWDLPGYGDTPPLVHDGVPAPLTFSLLADAVGAFVADVTNGAAADGGPVHVAGISFGGMIAQYAAAAHPGRFASLVLLSTSPKFGLDGTQPETWRTARLAPLDAGEEPVDFAERVLRGLAGPHITEDALRTQRDAMARISGAALRRSIDCLVTHDSRPVLASIDVPTLCLVGDLDEETPPQYARAIAEQIPDAEVVVIPGAGHLLNVEAADDVNRLIERHVDRVIARGRR